MTSHNTLIAILVLAAPLGAQQPRLPIDSGAMVRVTTVAERTTGRLLAQYAREDATLSLCTAPWNPCGIRGDTTGRRRYPTRELLRLEVRVGNRATSGAIIGGVAGVVVGGFFGMMFAAVCDAAECPSPVHGALVGSAMGGLTVGLVGAGIGSLVPRWRRVP